MAVCLSSETSLRSESAAWTIRAALISAMKASWEFLTAGSLTLETLTKWLKLSTMFPMSVSTLCINAFCFCAAAAAAAAVGPLPPPPLPATPPPPALFISLSLSLS
ncbi:hypothetical protein TorRG33x02_235400, partial [Trema orientale]